MKTWRQVCDHRKWVACIQRLYLVTTYCDQLLKQILTHLDSDLIYNTEKSETGSILRHTRQEF